MNQTQPLGKTAAPACPPLTMLTPEQVQRIDELLASVGEYGEVHLIVQKGQLRYVNRVESYKALENRPTKRA